MVFYSIILHLVQPPNTTKLTMMQEQVVILSLFVALCAFPFITESTPVAMSSGSMPPLCEPVCYRIKIYFKYLILISWVNCGNFEFCGILRLIYGSEIQTAVRSEVKIVADVLINLINHFTGSFLKVCIENYF